MKTKTVKCIRIDAKTHSLSYETRDVPVTKFLENVPDFHKAIMVREAWKIGFGNNGSGIETVLFHKEGVLSDPNDIPRIGFYFRPSTEDANERPFDPYIDDHTVVCGNGLLVSYKFDISKGFQTSAHAIPVDCEYSLEQARAFVPEFNAGVLCKIPEFTCMLNECFSAKGFELLLRLENEDELYAKHAWQLSRPIQMHSQQVVSFSFNYDDITIITGRINSPDDKVKAVIYETNRADLRQIAACTLTAVKIPSWIQERLQDHYFEKLVAARFRERREQAIRFARSKLSVVSPEVIR